MTMPDTREIAEHWFHALKSAPYADSWSIDDSFVDKLAATWPWVQAYFELLSKHPDKGFNWVVTLGIYALKETLDLRFDCAAALFMLLHLSRAASRISEPIPPETIRQYSDAVGRLVKSANEEEKTDEWLKWIKELWKEK